MVQLPVPQTQTFEKIVDEVPQVQTVEKLGAVGAPVVEGSTPFQTMIGPPVGTVLGGYEFSQTIGQKWMDFCQTTAMRKLDIE